MRHLFVLSLLVFTACPKRASTEHRFEHAEAWAASFEDPSRDVWQKPDEVLAALGLPPNASVADIGSATGYFSVRFARALPKGRVFGVDVESSMVDYLARRAETESLTNLKVILGDYDDPKLPAAVDAIVVVNTYHHIQDRPDYFRRLSSKLNASGRLIIIDFKRGSSRGPKDSEKLTAEMVTAELEKAGYAPASSWAFLPDQYFLAFTASTASK